MGGQTSLTGPDLAAGVPEADVRDGTPLLGHLDGEAVLLVREAGRLHAIGATCTHYGAPLADGRVAEGAIHCPWHHACFDLATGRAHGPAITALACWDVAVEGGRIRVGARRDVAAKTTAGPKSVVIIGGGAAGIACAEALRAAGHRGTITLVNGEGSEPVDRPNLSKDYLAGTAPEEWVFLRTAEALASSDIAVLADSAAAIDTSTKTVRLASSREVQWDALLIATGSEPIRLPIEGAQLPHVHTLRTLSDSRAIAQGIAEGAQVAVIGASFIGLEAAAALRERGAMVTVVAPEMVPLGRVLGEHVGSFVRRVHESRGVEFRLGRKPIRITADAVILDDGSLLPATLVVMGVGVKPRTQLAEAAGLPIQGGVLVDEELRAAPDIWAAGDIARYPWDTGLVRIEHWQVAVRHGQAVAASMLGQGPRRDVPFFWSQHHDVTLRYTGHAENFDPPEVKGDLDARDAHVVYRVGGVVRAVLTLGRDRVGLDVEAALERRDVAAVETLVR
jgi:apoptosis-inducing factor 3